MRWLKYIIIISLFLAAMHSAAAMGVGIIIKGPSGSVKTVCVNIASGTARDAIEAVDFANSWTGSGASSYLTSFDGTANSGLNAWSFWIKNDSGNNFQQANVGFGGHSIPTDDTVFGMSYATFDPITFEPSPSPPYYNYTDVCGLSFNEIKSYRDNDKQSADENGGSIKKVKPGSSIELKMKIENLYNDNTDNDIENVLITGTIENIDDGDELEEETDEFDVKTEDKESVTLTFSVPYGVDEDDYDLTLIMEGDGSEYDFDYRNIVKMTVEVKKDKHEMVIAKADLNRESVDCDRNVQLSVRAYNIGDEDEDDVIIRISSDTLGLSEEETYETIDEGSSDNDVSKTFHLIIPANALTGTARLKVEVVYDGDDKTETKYVDLMVNECTDATTTTTVTTTSLTTQTTTASTTPTGNVVAGDTSTGIVVTRPSTADSSGIASAKQIVSKSETAGFGFTLLTILVYVLIIGVVSGIVLKLKK